MKAIDRSMATVDSWQRSHRLTAVAYGVAKKFGDDNANQFVVGLGWYGFVAIYPLLLVVTTVLGFIGAASLGHHLVSTLHEFPRGGNPVQPGARVEQSPMEVPLGWSSACSDSSTAPRGSPRRPIRRC